MDKTLQDLAWSCLPKEFKEEVKYQYHNFNCYNYTANIEVKEILEYLFGLHNLTSDAEGEEMLTVSRTKIEALHSEIHKAIMDAHDADDWQDAAHYILDILPRSFNALFGSKCLPDEKVSDCHHLQEPKPAEPKFKEGDLVTIDDSPRGYVINGISYDDCYGEYLYGLTAYDVFKESELKLVPHSRLHMGDKVRVKENNRIGTIIESYSNDVGYRVFFDDGDGGEDAEFSEEELELYKEPAEPKLKVGDIASYVCSPTLKHKCTVTKVMQNEHNGKWEYNVMFEWGKPGMWIPESVLEPYTEPKEDHFVVNNEMVKDFDTILKDGFSKERRLNIAAMVMRGILSNPQLLKITIETYQEEIGSPNIFVAVAKAAKAQADALLAECEKGGNNGED